MSQIKLDNVSALVPIETVLSDLAPVPGQSALTESFGDHLQRAGMRPDETTAGSDADYPRTDPPPQSSRDTQPAADDRAGGPQDLTDVKSEENTTGQASPESAAENDRSEANEAETDADGREPSGSTEAGSQARQEQETDADAQAGEAKVVVDPGRLPGDLGPGPEGENAKGLQHTALDQEGENADPKGKTLSKQPVTNGESATAAVCEEDLAAAQNADSPDETAGRETDQAGDRNAEPGRATAAASRDRSDQPGGDPDQAADQGRQPGREAAQADAPRRSQRRGRKENAISEQIGEGAPAQPTKTPAHAAAATDPSVDVRTVSSEQTASAGAQKMDAAEGTAKPALSAATDGQSNLPSQVSPNQGGRAGSTQQLREATEPGQVDRVRFVQRVVRAFQAVGDRNSSVRLRLSPPELGSLRLEISVRNGMMTARIEAETPTARNLLLDNLPALRDRLAQQDIKVEQFDVDLMDRSPGGLSDRTAGDAKSHGHGRSNDSQQANTDTDGGTEATSDRRAVNRPGEGTQLNVVI